MKSRSLLSAIEDIDQMLPSELSSTKEPHVIWSNRCQAVAARINVLDPKLTVEPFLACYEHLPLSVALAVASGSDQPDMCLGTMGTSVAGRVASLDLVTLVSDVFSKENVRFTVDAIADNAELASC